MSIYIYKYWKKTNDRLSSFPTEILLIIRTKTIGCFLRGNIYRYCVVILLSFVYIVRNFFFSKHLRKSVWIWRTVAVGWKQYTVGEKTFDSADYNVWTRKKKKKSLKFSFININIERVFIIITILCCVISRFLSLPPPRFLLRIRDENVISKESLEKWFTIIITTGIEEEDRRPILCFIQNAFCFVPGFRTRMTTNYSVRFFSRCHRGRSTWKIK